MSSKKKKAEELMIDLRKAFMGLVIKILILFIACNIRWKIEEVFLSSNLHLISPRRLSASARLPARATKSMWQTLFY